MVIYKVGGSVRDKLLGLKVEDHDWVVVGSTPEEMTALGYRPVGKDFPVFLHPETQEEYALARTERKSGRGYKGFTFNTSPNVSLEDDLLRRDLTINAIAQDDKGNLVDPHHGREDLEQGILRHVSPAYREDPLRVLRTARFAARFNFQVAPQTLELMKDITASGELESLVPERIWTELEKALGCDHAWRFFEVLRDCEALARLFPEIDALFGIPQPPEHHPEIDTGIHTMMVLQQSVRLTRDKQIRFASLVHDLGKATTPRDMLPKHKGHEERGAKIIRKLCKRLKVPNKYRDLAVLVSRYHFICHKVDEIRSDTVINKLEALDAFRRPDRFEQFLVACEADARGRTGFEDKDYPQADQFRKYFDIANNVDTKVLQTGNIAGEEIAREIQNLRVASVENYRKSIQ
jgi:tRNA nucleotidyltransferase (CCA-adding enzyme)